MRLQRRVLRERLRPLPASGRLRGQGLVAPAFPERRSDDCLGLLGLLVTSSPSYGTDRRNDMGRHRAHQRTHLMRWHGKPPPGNSFAAGFRFEDDWRMFARSPRALATAGSLKDCCPRMREQPQRMGWPRERPSYFVWQEGKPPDVMWEFGAPLRSRGTPRRRRRRTGGWGCASTGWWIRWAGCTSQCRARRHPTAW